MANLSDAVKMLEITKGIDAIAFMIPVSLTNPFDGLRYAKNVINAAQSEWRKETRVEYKWLVRVSKN